MTIIHDLHWLAHKLVKRAKAKLPPVSEVFLSDRRNIVASMLMPKSSRGHFIGRERAQNRDPGNKKLQAICKASEHFTALKPLSRNRLVYF